MKKEDFPAGHSMDTNWFAVDKDGNVAVFDTGQEGVVPIQYAKGIHIFDFLENFTKRIANGLHELLLCNEQVDSIIDKCCADAINKVINEKTEYGAYFEGFFQLSAGSSWEDLNLNDVLKNSKHTFIIRFSHQKQLYFVFDIKEIENEFLAAIEKGIIIKGKYALLYEYEEDERFKYLSQKDLGLIKYEADMSPRNPYERKVIPDNILHVSQLSAEASKKLLTFNDFSFREMPYIQPLEFTSCEGYGLYFLTFDTIDYYLNQGYANVKLSDNMQYAHCKLTPRQLLEDSLNIYSCKICDVGKKDFNADYCRIKAFKDYPPVFLLFDFYDSGTFYDQMEEICLHLDLAIEDAYFTYCVKCFKKINGADISELSYRFNNCYVKLNAEIEKMFPVLIICVGSNVFELLKRKYHINIENFESGKFCEITINEKIIPALLLDYEEVVQNEKENLSVVSRIKELLSENRNIPDLPRILKT